MSGVFFRSGFLQPQPPAAPPCHHGCDDEPYDSGFSPVILDWSRMEPMYGPPPPSPPPPPPPPPMTWPAVVHHAVYGRMQFAHECKMERAGWVGVYFGAEPDGNPVAVDYSLAQALYYSVHPSQRR